MSLATLKVTNSLEFGISSSDFCTGIRYVEDEVSLLHQVNDISKSWGQTLWESATDLASAGVYYIDLASAGVYYIWAVADSNYDVLTLHDLEVKSAEEVRRYMT